MKTLLPVLLWGSMFFAQAQEVTLTVLGIAQDAGAPQMNCTKKCCVNRWGEKAVPVVALGVADTDTNQFYLFEATPDLPQQHRFMQQAYPFQTLRGIFLTHAHIGHYSGLMYLGKEAMGAKNVAVYAMPRMRNFLSNNAPWDQLVTESNIRIQPLTDGERVDLSRQLKVTPLQVPHRDEYSETVGYVIEGPTKKALFIPDIDKWERWEIAIETVLSTVDYAFLDATFFDGTELPNRDMDAIPHPFVIESMDRWKDLPLAEKSKIFLIHFNHTNALMQPHSHAVERVKKAGLQIAKVGQQFPL